MKIISQKKAFKLRFENFLKKVLKKKDKPYIVTHWHASLNSQELPINQLINMNQQKVKFGININKIEFIKKN